MGFGGQFRRLVNSWTLQDYTGNSPMNRQVFIASQVAILGAALALASTTTVAAKPTKPGGGGTANQCAGADTRGFPSFVFTRQATTNGVSTWGIYVADDDAKCEKLVGSSTVSRDIDFRYDPVTATGMLMHSSNGTELVAATVSVTFNADGSPVVQASAFQSLLPVAAVPIDELDDWTMQYIGSAEISHDGTAILFKGTDPLTFEHAIWTCPLNMVAASVNAADCRAVYRSTQFVASWGARDGTIYLLKPASSGSGTSLYRLTLAPTPEVVEVWSRGTIFGVVKATIDSDGRERVAVFEPNPPSFCARVLVIDADTCTGSSNDCTILNGQGHPARYLTWLRNGRLVAEGRTVPSRKGQCDIDGKIVTFDATDTNATTTTLNQGFYPNGSGGG